MSKLSRMTLAAAMAAVLTVTFFAERTSAAEPRPWLCRDKPVFSYDRAMEYQVTARPGRQWQIFFMQFSPNAAHDGFDIVSARDLGIRGLPLGGKLAAGRYYVVVMYRAQGGYWVCPGTARENAPPKLRIVSDLCFAEDGPSCRVSLTVKPDHTLAGPGAP
jgi:hypothetical protein